jgi:hypothetical protein
MDFNSIILKDGTIIYSEDMLHELLLSIGMDNYDMDNLADTIIARRMKQLGYDCDNLNSFIDENKEYERVADNYFCNMRDMTQEIEDIVAEMRQQYSGKKTNNYLDKIISTIKFYYRS